MKKSKTTILLFIFVFISFFLNSKIYALEDNQQIEEYKNNYVESDNFFYVYDGTLILEDDNIYVYFIIDDMDFKYDVSNYNFYSFKEDKFYLGIEESKLKISNLVNGTIEICPNNEIILDFSFADGTINKIIGVTIKEKIEMLDFFSLFQYNDLDNEYYEMVIHTKSYYRELKNYYKKLNTPSILATTSEDENSAIEAVKSLTNYQDESIKTYYKRGSRWDSSGNRLDDPIVDYIPREYFFTECSHLEYGEAYGFYIETIEEVKNQFYSFVNVFVLDFTYPTGTISLSVDKRFLNIEFVPLFNLEYYSYIKDENTESLNFGNSTSFVLADIPIECGYSSFLVNNSIENYYGLNYDDEGYTLAMDYGMCIEQTEYKILNYENNSTDTEYIDNFYFDLYLSIISLDPYISPIVDIYKFAEDLYAKLKENENASVGTIVSSTNEHKCTYAEPEEQLNLLSAYFKKVTFGFDLDTALNDKYYIGRFSYANYGEVYEEKVKFCADILYTYISYDNRILQKSNTTFITKLYSLSGTKYELKTFVFNEENQFMYNKSSEYYTTEGELNPDFDMNNIIPVIFVSDSIRNFIVTPRVSMKMIIQNAFGVELFNKIITNEEVSVSFPMNADERYFIKFETISGNTGTVSLQYNSSMFYALSIGTNTYTMSGYDSVGYRLYVSEIGYYNIDAYGSDTEIYLYQKDRLIDYNDYWYSWDEEMNLEYEDEAHLALTLDAGYYYIIIYKKSSSTSTVQTIINAT